MRADLPVERAQLADRAFQRRPVGFQQGVEVVRAKRAFPVSPGRLSVDLGDHHARAVQRRQQVFVRHAQAVAALGIGRSHLQ
ncbi:hypothetical protein D3C80_1681040 [compost metagenome]